jgi:hypothetical protein
VGGIILSPRTLASVAKALQDAHRKGGGGGDLEAWNIGFRRKVFQDAKVDVGAREGHEKHFVNVFLVRLRQEPVSHTHTHTHTRHACLHTYINT